MFLQFFKDLSNDINISLTLIFNINKHIILVKNEKDIKLFGQDLIDIILKTSQSIKKSKYYYLILKMTVFSLKVYFLFPFLIFI